MRSVSTRRAIALCASLAVLAALPATATATSSQAEIDAAVGKAVEYVRAQQKPELPGEPELGAIPGFGGDWLATSLAAAGVDTANVHGPNPGDPSFQDYLLYEYTLPTWDEDPPGGTATEYARSILVSHAAGLNPARLSATSNQPAQLAGRWNPALGSFGEASSYNTAFGIMAMKTAGLPTWALAPAVSFLRRNQHVDGGWTYGAALTPLAQAEASEEDITGAAIAALCEAGVPAYDPAVTSALTYLHGRLVSGTGGFEYLWGEPNSDTNAWVLSGLTACGIDPQSAQWTAGGKTPIDFLLSLQVQAGEGAGGFGYEDASLASLYSTQDALRAIAGGVFTADPQSVRPAPAVAAGTPVPHLLAIELAPGNVRLCKLTAPAGAPLVQVLNAAKASSHPAGCVTSLAVAGGQVASIDGVSPAGVDEAWLARLDHGSQALAAEQPVGFGDLISLRLGTRPGGSHGVPGPAGDAGKAGAPGARGKRGSKGRPGRNASISCKSRHRRSGKRRVHCTVTHREKGARRR
jgi:hypothetical protein